MSRGNRVVVLRVEYFFGFLAFERLDHAAFYQRMVKTIIVRHKYYVKRITTNVRQNPVLRIKPTSGGQNQMKIRQSLFALFLIFTLTACTQPTAAPTPTHTIVPPTPTVTATITSTLPPPTETVTPSPTATASPTPTLTPTATFTPRPQHPPLITFTMEQNGVPSIYAIAPDGSGLTLLAADVSLYNYDGPLWSPDGQNIAFLSGASFDTGRLNILNYAIGGNPAGGFR